MLSFKRLAPAKLEGLLAASRESCFHDPRVSYPSWYLHRWHFLPEGYLSRRSVRLYDRFIRRLYHSCAEGSALRQLLDLAREARPSRVLEIGCGPARPAGLLASELAEAEVVAVDLSTHMLEQAALGAASQPNLTFVHADAASLPFPEGHFDLAFASHVFGHMPRDAGRAALHEAARVLRPGALLATVEHRWHSLRAPLTLRRSGRWSAGRGAAFFTAYVREP